MTNLFLFRWFRDVPIARKLYFTVGIMALLISVELFALFFSLSTLSSLRAYVGCEGLWSKAQKDAVFHLYKYGVSRNQEDYVLFRAFMRVPVGDGRTRRELEKATPDMEVARQGFLEGRNHPDDVDGMIELFRNFKNIYYIEKAITIWGEAEPLALQLLAIGEKLHEQFSSQLTSQDEINNFLDSIGLINQKLTVLEDKFSYTLGEGSRWLEGVVLRLLFMIAITVEISGLLLAISVSRNIHKGLTEIIRAAKSFAKGLYSTRAKAFSRDEIGEVADSFNRMSDELECCIVDLEQAHTKFRLLLECAPDAIIITDKGGKKTR